VSRLKVLVVDDSAFARKVIRETLERDPDIEVVGIARDGLEALEKFALLKPDLLTLDLMMPDLDGIGVLRALPKDNFPRVIVVTTSGSDTDVALEALELGAVDIVQKPTAQATDRLYDLGTELLAKVKEAGRAVPRRAPLPEPMRVPAPALSSAARLIVIGTSTGGPQALSQIFRALPAGLKVPIAIALHIPAGYTGPLAARISLNSAIPMEEAHEGMELLPGRAVLAAGGLHLRIREVAGRFFAVVSSAPRDLPYHPSVDELFKSAAAAAGSGVVGVVLTGMGNDGEAGSAAIRAAGGRVLAESEESCVVYGMPRTVIEGGHANAQAPLEGIPALLVHTVASIRG
jgi:two-component system chemotaxis response regulator CheB